MVEGEQVSMTTDERKARNAALQWVLDLIEQETLESPSWWLEAYCDADNLTAKIQAEISGE